MATLYLDEDVSHHIGALLEIAGHTIYTTYQQRRVETWDGDQLLYAAANGWTIVSHNRRDFELLHDAWLRWTDAWNVSNHHPGILIISQRISHHDNAAVIESLLSVGPNRENQMLGYDVVSHAWGVYDVATRSYAPLR